MEELHPTFSMYSSISITIPISQKSQEPTLDTQDLSAYAVLYCSQLPALPHFMSHQGNRVVTSGY